MIAVAADGETGLPGVVDVANGGAKLEPVWASILCTRLMRLLHRAHRSPVFMPADECACA
jgi:hypothetical protein